MRRFLIFLLFFPAVATAAFYVVTYVLTGAVQDSGTGPVLLYLVFIVPGLLIALFDGLFAKTSMPVVTTTLLAYGLSVLIMAGLLGASRQLVLLGLIGAIPAAACSWLSNKSKDSVTV